MTQTSGCLSFAKKFFISIIKDFRGVAWWAGILLFIFGSLMIIFSVVDFNSFVHPERGLDILKWNNDEAMEIEYWRRVLMSLSGAASFTGAVCVVLTTYGKLSSYFWGVINAILYGLFAFAYGYGGDAQLNIIFFLPMQFWGMYTWNDNIDETDERVKSRKLGVIGWVLCLTFGFGVSCAFYFEIPHFVTAIQGIYFFEDNQEAHMLDAATNGLNIIGQLLLLFRYWEQWIFWIAVDCLQIVMYSGVAGFGVDFNILFMWSLYLVNALFGLYVWFMRERYLRNQDVIEKLKKNKISDMNNINNNGDLNNVKLTTEGGNTERNEEIGLINITKHKIGVIFDQIYPLSSDSMNLIEEKINLCEKTYLLIPCLPNENEKHVKILKNWLSQLGYFEKKNIKIEFVSIKDLSLEKTLKKLKIEKGINLICASDSHKGIIDNFLKKKKNNIETIYYHIDSIDFSIDPQIIKYNINNLNSLHPISKSYFVPRIVLIGPESTGKTTLAKNLGDFYKTIWVREMGREICEKKLEDFRQKNKQNIKSNLNSDNLEIDYEWKDSDFKEIVTSQNSLELESAKNANKVLICDTDSFATLVWYERYMKKQLNEIEIIHKDHATYNNLSIYFLINHEKKAFIQDGTRDGLHVREWMFKRFEERLKEWKKIFFVIEGDYEETEEKIRNKIKDIFDI